MGLYERSLKTMIKIKGSNTEAFKAVQALSDEMGSEIMDQAELFITREVYDLMVSQGYYKPKERSDRDRRSDDRRKGVRRDE